ncbi:hypothetical protein C1645_811475 [Glomus cerebriforme]|uniref:Uncharacterized protein n=1 Tax=Glomus cerebriforme TaxID=658196 RepID=A0A397TND8_9GLOM|nr:hypothetical protein C1645_811475 [Glomus cerebriforme]
MTLKFRLLNIAPIFLIFIVVTLSSCVPIENNYTFAFAKDPNILTNKIINNYADGTILFETQYVDTPSRVNKNFYLLYPDGSSTFVKDVEIPCISCEYEVYRLNPNYIFINYKMHEKYFGMIMDWEKNIISKKFHISDTKIPIIMSNKNVPKFLIANFYKGMNETNQYISYNEYEVSGKYIFSRMSGNLTVDIHRNLTDYKIFPLDDYTDDTWGIIFNLKDSTSVLTDTYFAIIRNGLKVQISENMSLPLPQVDFNNFACVVDKVIDLQYYCLYTTVDIRNQQVMWIKINYYSSTNTFNTFDNSSIVLSDYFEIINPIIRIIPNVGFLMKLKVKSKYVNLILNSEINYLDTNLNYTFGQWTSGINYENALYLHNKTIIAYVNDSFNYTSIDISSMISENNNYNNFHVKQTYPSWNETIPTGQNSMTIKFVHPINLLGNAYASIYYNNNGNFLLRQRYICVQPNCQLTDDDYSINMNIVDTTFNIPGATYYVEIDDGFAEYKRFEIVMPGIKWPINTSRDEKNTIVINSVSSDDVVKAKFHLTHNGTNFYRKLNENEKRTFIEQMRIQISKSIPVDDSRLSDLDIFPEYDKDSEVDLFTITFMINPPSKSSFNQKSSRDVLQDFKNLMASDIMTSLDTSNYTKYIDKKYGVTKTGKYNLWDEITIDLRKFKQSTMSVISLVICLILLISLYLFGRYKNKKGNNLIVFQVALIFFDSVTDILFIITHKEILQQLLIPSIVIVCVSFLINTTLAFYIFIFEIKKNPEFSAWFKNNSKIGPIITLFSSGNVELLHLLNSNFAGLEPFSAPFSMKAIFLILCGRFLNILIEDLPQLIIQIIFAIKFTESYNQIALCNLITSSIVLTTGIIGFIYDIVSKKYKRQVTLYTSNSEFDQEKDVLGRNDSY